MSTESARKRFKKDGTEMWYGQASDNGANYGEGLIYLKCGKQQYDQSISCLTLF